MSGIASAQDASWPVSYMGAVGGNKAMVQVCNDNGSAYLCRSLGLPMFCDQACCLRF